MQLIRHRDAGSNPSRPLHFQHSTLAEVKEFICDNHYLHSVPAGVTHVYSIVCADELVGAAVFGYGAGNPRAFWGYPPCLFRELVRFVLVLSLPKNAESMFLGWCLRSLSKDAPELIAAISYADPAQGHNGCIYRATNFHYLGQFRAHRGVGRGKWSPVPKHKFVYIFSGRRGHPK